MNKLENVVLASPEQMEFIIEGMRNGRRVIVIVIVDVVRRFIEKNVRNVIFVSMRAVSANKSILLVAMTMS